STATIPLAIALVREFTGCAQEQAEAKGNFSSTDYSYEALADGDADLLLVYEASEQTKVKLNVEQNFDITPIGLDALVFIVNADNPVNALTTAQIQDIYSGKITNWKELGGKDLPIFAFQRPNLSGSQTMMQKLVMGDISVAQAPSEFIEGDMAGLIRRIASYDNTANAIGYSVYYYAKNMYALPGLKFIAVDGVAPSETNIAARKYPFINEFFAVLPQNAAGNPKLLRDWLLTDDGQVFVQSCGYVPISPAAAPETPAAAVNTQDLWDKDYFAVLYGEGETRLVYDSKGQPTGSFTLRGLGQETWLSPGLHTAQELAEEVLFVNGKQLPLAPETVHLPTGRHANGFTRFDDAEGILYVYDKNFKLKYTVDAEPDVDYYEYDVHHYDVTASVFPLGENELVFFSFSRTVDFVRPQMRSKTGKLLAYPTLKDPTARIVGVFAEKYLLTQAKDETWSICDLDGNVRVSNTTPVAQEIEYISSWGSWSDFFPSRYYVKNGWLYGADLRPISVAKLNPAYQLYRTDFYREVGPFIEGLRYDLGGAISTGEVFGSKWGAFIQGWANDTVYVRRGDKIYQFATDNPCLQVQDFNDNFVYLYNSKTKRGEVRLLKTSEVFLWEGDYYRLNLSDYYFTVDVRHFPVDSFEKGYHIFDQAGKLRYSAGDNYWCWFRPLPGEVVLMQRGPYVGIADMDGNWLIKTLQAYNAYDVYDTYHIF
ncbi:MAG: substrate-binding domain-containing protein, partial [Clostridiales bacterium]|nr:substrate-binding domain-containing protein [Clostridiales bacterium]